MVTHLHGDQSWAGEVDGPGAGVEPAGALEEGEALPCQEGPQGEDAGTASQERRQGGLSPVCVCVCVCVCVWHGERLECK